MSGTNAEQSQLLWPLSTTFIMGHINRPAANRAEA